MKRKKKRCIKIILIILAILILGLFLIRLISPSEIDDVSPGINCPELDLYNPSILYVIPDYTNHTLSSYPEWCNYILSLNKNLQLHGITHTYREFLYSNISQEKLDFGIGEFKKCFNQTPVMFKPPQIKINKENKQLIKDNNLKIRTGFNQITHKVYHCNDSSKPHNNIIKIF